MIVSRCEMMTNLAMSCIDEKDEEPKIHKIQFQFAFLAGFVEGL